MLSIVDGSNSNSSSEMATNLINLRLSISIIDNAQSVGHADKVLFIKLSVTWLRVQVSPIYVAIMSTIDKLQIDRQYK